MLSRTITYYSRLILVRSFVRIIITLSCYRVIVFRFKPRFDNTIPRSEHKTTNIDKNLEKLTKLTYN